ncbi:MAG: neutral zinc metallopeptidase [Gemmatimonadaceae bacterium]
MRWTPGQRSEDIEDRRGEGGGGMRGLPGGAGRLGLGGMVLLLILSLVFKQDFFSLLSGAAPGPSAGESSAPVRSSPQEDSLVQFVSFVLDDAQGTWAKVFQQAGRPWQNAKLVLYREGTQTACGVGESAAGPFYCPGDQKVYIDLGFYEELQTRFGAPGDFAQAYVLAHELGHHVQNLLGTDARVRRLQRSNPDSQNALSVRLELQADCYAGIWANNTNRRDLLQQGDVEEGLRAAAAVGDDRLQKQMTGHVNPDAFTHGTSQERMQWFQRGFQTGQPEACDTFKGAS